MEKICIVKLRKNFRTSLAPEANAREGTVGGHGDSAGMRVSVTLTGDQTRALKSNPHLASLLYEKPHALPGKMGHGEAEMTIHLELPSLPPVRLLKLGEVTRMLRISRSSLHRILNEGTMKSYKLGRLRRLMLDDVLSYLASHQESPVEQRAEKAITSRSGMVQPYAIKED